MNLSEPAGILDRTAARFESFTWALKVVALIGYAVVWFTLYHLAS